MEKTHRLSRTSESVVGHISLLLSAFVCPLATHCTVTNLFIKNLQNEWIFLAPNKIWGIVQANYPLRCLSFKIILSHLVDLLIFSKEASLCLTTFWQKFERNFGVFVDIKYPGKYTFHLDCKLVHIYWGKKQ